MTPSIDYLKQSIDYLISKHGFRLVLEQKPTNDIFHHGYLTYKLEREYIQITISREEYLWYVSFAIKNIKEYSMQSILKKIGVSSNRYPVINGIWEGYKIENVAHDLQTHIEQILEFINIEYLKTSKRKTRLTKSR